MLRRHVDMAQILEHRLVCLAFFDASARMAPVGGNKPALGTNPLGFGVPPAALAGNMAPAASHKGYALAWLVDVLVAGSGAAAWSFEASPLLDDNGGSPGIQRMRPHTGLKYTMNWWLNSPPWRT